MERLSDGTGYRTKIRFGKGLQRRFRLTTTDETEAAKREEDLRDIGETIGKAKIDPEIGARLLADAGEGNAKAVRATVARIVAGMKVGKADAPKAGAITTMAQLGTAWTSGDLAAKHPDHVKLKVTSDRDKQRLAHMAKTIGNVPVKAFTLADAELAMAALPKDLASATRRQYAQILAKLLHLAVYPLKLIQTSPLPRGFLPKVTRTKATAWLYPAEEAQLMACHDVPLARRVLYGLLAREGLRCGEALRLSWGDLDLKRGVVKLDKNKTNDPRAWAMAPGVATALKSFKQDSAEPDDLVFLAQVREHMADDFRRDLAAAGVARAELYERSKTRQPIRVHDLRATFVTLALAEGRSEAWVSDRTGHRSSVMIANYRRAARTAAELNLGSLAALDRAIPELGVSMG